MGSMVQKCKECGNRKYIVSDKTCLSCIKKESPEEVLVGISTNICTLDPNTVTSAIENATSNFPRIVHSNSYKDVENFHYSAVDIKDEYIVVKRFNIVYKYDDYDGLNTKQILYKALKDVYRDLVEQKFG